MTYKGWVYVITNRGMPGIVKVGFSTKDPALRAKELGNTGVPHPYDVEYEALVDEPKLVERRAHVHLQHCREGREWFRCTVLDAVRAIRASAPQIQFESLPVEPEPAKANSPELQRDVQAVASGRPAAPRPTGTYTGRCPSCGSQFSVTLGPRDRTVTCPDCLRVAPASGMQAARLII